MIEAGDNLCALFSRYARKTTDDNEQEIKKEISSSGTHPNELPQMTIEKHQDYGTVRFADTFLSSSSSTATSTTSFLNDPSEENVCDCMKINGTDLKCATCLAHDSLRCSLCPMVFLDKSDIERHLSTSHTSEKEMSTTTSIEEDEKKKPAEVATTITATTPSSSGLKLTIKKFASSRMRAGAQRKSTPDREETVTATMAASSTDVAAATTTTTATATANYECKTCSKVCVSFRGLMRHSAVHKNSSVVAKTAKITADAKEETPSIGCNFCDQTFPHENDKRKHVSEYHRINFTLVNGATADAASSDATKKELDSELLFTSELTVAEDEKENIEEDAFKKDGSSGGGKDKVEKAAKKDRKRRIATDDESAKKKHAKRKKKSPTARDGGKDVYTCAHCDKGFERKSSYARHLQTHSSGGEFVCDVCAKRFTTELMLKRHKSSVHRTKRVKLSEEEDPFRKWYVFADGQKHLKCDQCKYNSLWYHKGRFLEHYRIHTGEKPFTCDLCGKQFRTKTLLQKHVMFVHEGIKEHSCDICGRCFSDKRYMEDHRRIHTGERPYVCDLCGKTFKQGASLFIHKELHKGLRKHGCDMCGKRFTTRSSLTIHIKRHIGERNFICATCGKAFVDGKHLKDHMAVHSEERPFSCELCGGRFKLMKHLKQHGRTHKRYNQ